MIKRSELVRLRDMLENIDAAVEMMADIDVAAYRRDYKLRRGGGEVRRNCLGSEQVHFG